MDEEKINDVTPSGVSSSCCGADVYGFGEAYMCKDCKEYCEAIAEE